MNRRFSSIEELEAYERRLRAMEYENYARPILREMANIKSLFSSPWMIVRDGTVVESGEKWTDRKMEALYLRYEQALQLFKLQIIDRP